MKSMSNFKQFFSLFFIAILFVACDKTKSTPVDAKATQAEDGSISTNLIENPTKVTFTTDVYDFGDIIQNEKVKTEFKFTNTGDHDLIISSARGTCGCTVPEWPKEPIKPGDSGVIKIQFDSKNKSGPFNKTVTVTANTVPSETKILIKGVVIVPKDK